MELILLILGLLFLLAGLLGAIVPVLPGPPLGYAGLLLLQGSAFAHFSAVFLVVWAVIVVAVTIMDYTLPAWLTKKFGGSRAAVIGSVLGLVIGIFFFPPIGLVIGPFLGALLGELLNNNFKANSGKGEAPDASSQAQGNIRALTAAMGAFLAFIVGTGAKLIAGSIMIYYAVKALIVNFTL